MSTQRPEKQLCQNSGPRERGHLEEGKKSGVQMLRKPTSSQDEASIIVDNSFLFRPAFASSQAHYNQ